MPSVATGGNGVGIGCARKTGGSPQPVRPYRIPAGRPPPLARGERRGGFLDRITSHRRFAPWRRPGWLRSREDGRCCEAEHGAEDAAGGIPGGGGADEAGCSKHVDLTHTAPTATRHRGVAESRRLSCVKPAFRARERSNSWPRLIMMKEAISRTMLAEMPLDTVLFKSTFRPATEDRRAEYL